MRLVNDFSRLLESAARRVRSPRTAGICILAGAFVFYCVTLAPTVIWGDSAAFAIQAADLDLSFGADSHPLFVLLGRLFSYLPLEPAYSLNLLAAVTASLAVTVIYLVIFELTSSVAPAVFGAVSLMLSHAFWLHAVIAEVYDLNVLFVALIALVLLRWHKNPDRLSLVYLAAFLFGLGLTNHLVLILEVIGFVVFLLISDWRRVLRLKTLLIATCLSLCGSSLLVYLFVKKLTAGRTVPVLLDAATGGPLRHAMGVVSSGLFRDFLMYVAYLFYQFPLIGFFLGIVGIFALFRDKRKEAVFLLLLLGINMVFFLSFGPGAKRTTKYTFYISDYALFAVFIGCGVSAFFRYLARKGISGIGVSGTITLLIVGCPLLLYNLTPPVAKALRIDLLHARSIAYRDNDSFFLNPSKRGYYGAARYAEEVLKVASPNCIILADYTPYVVLRYYQRVIGMRNDILILRTGEQHLRNTPESVVREYYSKRDIYLADMEKSYYWIRPLVDKYDFVPVGILHKIERKQNKAELSPGVWTCPIPVSTGA